MITRKKKAKLLNYYNNFQRDIIEKPDKAIFNIKRKTLQDIINLTCELLFEYGNNKIVLNEYIDRYNTQLNLNKYAETVLNDYKYKFEILRKYFYRCNKAIKFIKENASYDKEIKSCCDDLLYSDCDKLIRLLGGNDNE